MVMPRSRSRSFESITRSATTSFSRKAPVWRRRWSTRVVLPWSTWATMAMLRRSLRGMFGGGRLAQGPDICEGRWKSRRNFAMVGAMDLDVLRQVSEEFIPFNKLLGIQVTALERGRAVFEIPFREELVGDPIKRVLHGGVISALADTAGGTAVWSAVMNPECRVST